MLTRERSKAISRLLARAQAAQFNDYRSPSTLATASIVFSNWMSDRQVLTDLIHDLATALQQVHSESGNSPADLNAAIGQQGKARL